MTRFLVVLLVNLLICTHLHAKVGTVNPFNVPDELRSCLRSTPDLEINESVNPFYISGDFDGDGITDFSVQVISKKSKREGVLFCLSTGQRPLWGAGKPNAVLKADQKWPFDSWILIRKGSKHLSVYPRIRFDVIALIIADEGGGLLYWDGKALRWQQEE